MGKSNFRVNGLECAFNPLNSPIANGWVFTPWLWGEEAFFTLMLPANPSVHCSTSSRRDYLTTKLPRFGVRRPHLFLTVLLTLALVLGSIFSARASANNWLGGTSTNWNDATNLDQGLPSALSSVIINSGTGNQTVISSAAAYSNGLTVGEDANSAPGANLTIEFSQTLATSGSGTIGDGSGSVGNILVTDSSTLWSVAGLLTVGNSGTGNLSIVSDATVSAQGGVMVAAQGGGSGTMTINSGGMLQVGGTNGLLSGDGTASVSMDGGYIQVINSDLTGNLNIALNNTNLTPNYIDTAGFNATL